MSTNKHIIFNADDFGLHPSITRGIIDCFNNGPVKNTSVITSQPDWSATEKIISQNPDLDYGIHLNLSIGSSNFKRLLFPKYHQSLYHELFNQTKRLQLALSQIGKSITHLDFHQHLFFIPLLFKLCLQIKDEFNIPWIRIPYQKHTIYPLWHKNYFKKLFLNPWFKTKKNNPLSLKVNSFDSIGCPTLHHHYNRLLNASDTYTEIVVHPGQPHTDQSDPIRKQREYEWQFLTSDACQSLLNKHTISSISFSDILTL